jgi:hypothetical protein
MKTTYVLLALLLLLPGCDIRGLSKEEIESLCADVGLAAYWNPKVAAGPEAKAIQRGAEAECKLKHIGRRTVL